MRRSCLVAVLLGCLAGSACKSPPPKPPVKVPPVKAADISAARLQNADREPQNWMTHGRTYTEQRFSPLKEINDQNAGRLGLAWYYDLDTHRGQESTPLVIDGTMYFTTAWSKVVALDAETGARLWTYDPYVRPEWAVNACCDVVNRGLAAWNGKLFFGTLDGRLVALNARNGKLAWEKLTIDPNSRYTITGAPRVVKGKVIIGNGGGEMSVRGYVSAYDAETGDLAWRFYTVPGDPAKPFETPALEKAAKTWTGQWWKLGGGGTVWDSMAYDPELDLLYIGTGNGSPWNDKYRSPGGGDNLYTCSIIALKPETGEYVWHYQEDPADAWDYDAAEQMILADLNLGGQTRKVLLQAPKNGFFYVLDRATGKPISATPFTHITWATGIDPATWRPIEAPNARYRGSNATVMTPGPLGAHSWHPMSFSSLTGLVYIPVNEAGFNYKSDAQFKPGKFGMQTGTDDVAAALPQDAKIKQAVLSGIGGKLVAWDPVQQKQAWAVDRSGPWNGGVLSTAGNLVFEGTASGQFEAYRADNGKKLWSFEAQTGVMAGPISYRAQGNQYVAVLAGWGGVFPLVAGEVSFKSGRVRNLSRMLVFKLDGKDALPAPTPVPEPVLNPPPSRASADTIHRGERLFQHYCSACHGDVAVSGGVLPDLRYSGTLSSDQWFSVVLDGVLQPGGMVSFKTELSRDDAAAIREYVIQRANQALAEKKQPPK